MQLLLLALFFDMMMRKGLVTAWQFHWFYCCTARINVYFAADYSGIWSTSGNYHPSGNTHSPYLLRQTEGWIVIPGGNLANMYSVFSGAGVSN